MAVSSFACFDSCLTYTPVALLIVGNGPAAAKTAMRGAAVSCPPFCGHFVGYGSGLDLITAVPFSVGRSLLMLGGVFARPLAFLLQDLVKRITQCAERFAPSNSWYVGVITKVFRLAGDMVKPEVAHNLMQLIAEGSGEDEEADVALRRDAVDNYLDLLETPAVPDQVRVSACVVACAGLLFCLFHVSVSVFLAYGCTYPYCAAVWAVLVACGYIQNPIQRSPPAPDASKITPADASDDV